MMKPTTNRTAGATTSPQRLSVASGSHVGTTAPPPPTTSMKPSGKRSLTARLLSMVVVAAVILSTVLTGSAAGQPPPEPDPESQFPSSTEDEHDIDIEFFTFPDGQPFQYGTHYGIWSANCELVQELEGETDEWVTWQSFLEADPNYDCGDDHRAVGANANTGATGVGGYGRLGLPADAFHCGVDVGAWNHADRKIFAFACSAGFGLNKMVVSWSIAVVEWAFRFNIGTSMAPFTGSVGEGYFGALHGVNSAYWAALTFTTFYAAVKVLRGQMSRGMSELGLSVLLLMAFWAIVVNGSGFGGLTAGALNTTAEISSEIGQLTLDPAATAGCPGQININLPAITPPFIADIVNDAVASHNDRYGGTGALVCPMANGLFITLVERPSDLIQWGQVLDDTPCAGTRDAILLSGPWGNDDNPRHLMAQCDQGLADFNHDPSDARIGMVVVTLLVSLLTLILVVGMALVLLIAQVVLALTIMVMPFAMISAALPGTGRNLFAKWLTVFIKVAVLTIFMTGLLALHLSTLNVAMRASENAPWAAQAAVMVMVTIMSFSLMRKAVAASGNAAVRTTRALAATVGQNGAPTAGLATAGRFAQRSLNGAARATSLVGKTTAVAGVGVGTVAAGGVAAASLPFTAAGAAGGTASGAAVAGNAASAAAGLGAGVAAVGAAKGGAAVVALAKGNPALAGKVIGGAVLQRAAAGSARRALDKRAAAELVSA